MKGIVVRHQRHRMRCLRFVIVFRSLPLLLLGRTIALPFVLLTPLIVLMEDVVIAALTG